MIFISVTTTSGGWLATWWLWSFSENPILLLHSGPRIHCLAPDQTLHATKQKSCFFLLALHVNQHDSTQIILHWLPITTWLADLPLLSHLWPTDGYWSHVWQICDHSANVGQMVTCWQLFRMHLSRIFHWWASSGP